MSITDESILILCKTYPSPSGKYVETSCVAGMSADGQLIRLYPVPFRLVQNEQQFRKWQWIEAKIEKANNDHRPESYRLKIDTLKCIGDPIPTKNNWAERWNELDRQIILRSFDEIEKERLENGKTLGFLRPKRILSLEISPVSDPEWSDSELSKLLQQQNQIGLFEENEKANIATLKKLPFSFYYNYECDDVIFGTKVFKHKIADWEVGALYWRCRKNYGSAWEEKFRIKLEEQIPTKDLIFLMGNIQRFPHQWLIVSLIYPPYRKNISQGDLF